MVDILHDRQMDFILYTRKLSLIFVFACFHILQDIKVEVKKAEKDTVKQDKIQENSTLKKDTAEENRKEVKDWTEEKDQKEMDKNETKDGHAPRKTEYKPLYEDGIYNIGVSNKTQFHDFFSCTYSWSLMAGWSNESQWHKVICHDTEVMGLNHS